MKNLSRLAILLSILVILAIQIGCSSDVETNDAGQQTAIVEPVPSTASIPFKQHLYSKSSPNFAWEWSGTEDVQQEIAAKYATLSNVAPGGFLVKETDTDYYICVSIGGTESVTEGFEIKSLTLPEQNNAEEPTLSIKVAHVSGENAADKQLQGAVHVTSLISVSKADLPEGVKINPIVMGLES